MLKTVLKSVKNLHEYLEQIIDIILPRRTDFDLVKKLTPEKIYTLPKSMPTLNMDWVTPLFQYKNNYVRALIWELKFHENVSTLETIGKMMYEEILALVSDIILFDSGAKFLLLPIPITPTRRRERGYNQSDYIAKAILEHDLGHILLYAPQWFEKIKDTPQQSKSHSKQERMENLHGCFEADPRIENHYVILIDDVVTTGSTLSEARHTLLSVGATDVIAFTIAH